MNDFDFNLYEDNKFFEKNDCYNKDNKFFAEDTSDDSVMEIEFFDCEDDKSESGEKTKEGLIVEGIGVTDGIARCLVFFTIVTACFFVIAVSFLVAAQFLIALSFFMAAAVGCAYIVSYVKMYNNQDGVVFELYIDYIMIAEKNKFVKIDLKDVTQANYVYVNAHEKCIKIQIEVGKKYYSKIVQSSEKIITEIEVFKNRIEEKKMEKNCENNNDRMSNLEKEEIGADIYNNAVNRTIRKYTKRDFSKVINLFYETVQEVNSRDYTAKQINAWIKCVNKKKWKRELLANHTYVAEMDGMILGFGDIEKTGYLNRLYVGKNFLGIGIGTAICEKLERCVFGISITTHASITAKTFFENRGYVVIQKQSVERNGEFLTNYVMEK